MKKFPGKVGIQQRVLPFYRIEFFEELAVRCDVGLSIFAGDPLGIEGINVNGNFKKAHFTRGRNLNLFDPSSKYYLCWQVGLIKWLKKWDPDVLIVEANPRYLNTWTAINWMHRRGKNIIGWGLGAPDPEGFFTNFRRRSREKFLHSLDALIAYSSKGAEEYRKLGYPSESIYIAVNAVSRAPSGEFPERARILVKPPTVLFVGRLQARKRVDILIQACSELADEIKPKLVIVGDGPAREKYNNLANEIYPGTVFPGEKRGEELGRFFLEADLFVLPGTGGLAAQQAMSFGLPVIMAEGDGTQSDLIREDNGWLVTAGNLGKLIDTLTIALSDVSRLRYKGENAFRTVKEEINIERMAEVFVESLLGENKH
jgi:glycosyltransferase involved in cell wall biosynthesis